LKKVYGKKFEENCKEKNLKKCLKKNLGKIKEKFKGNGCLLAFRLISF